METLKEQEELNSLEDHVLVIKDENTQEETVIPLKKVPLKSERNQMNRERKLKWALFLAALTTLCLGILIGLLVSNFVYPGGTNMSYDARRNEIKSTMMEKWLYGKDYENLSEELDNKALKGMTTFVEDPYTEYMAPSEMKEFATSINMNYVGIGIQYQKLDETILVKDVFRGSPAEAAGMQVGDLIKTVEGKDVTSLSTSEIKDMVAGNEGTLVTVGIERYGQPMTLKIIRGKINHTVFCEKQEDYLILTIESFGSTTAREIEAYLNEYPEIEKVIIDLRGNTGGYQSSVSEVAGLFIGNNKVYLKQVDVKGNERQAYTFASSYFDNIKKIVVLIDGETASASEVLAICLKEQHPDTTLVGTNSFGKGVIQSNVLLSDGGYLKITTENWYSPNGEWMGEVGIVPDEEVYMDDVYYVAYIEMEEDEQYTLDSVSHFTKVCQYALRYMDYDIDRVDGYFNENFKEQLFLFEEKNGIEQTDVLTRDLYERIVAETSRTMTLDESKDLQLEKAKELLK